MKLLLLSFVALVCADLYSAGSGVKSLTPKDFTSEVLDNDGVTIVEFYADWCGHCQNLKPTYEKLAKRLKGLATVAAVQCDAPENQELCSRHGVRGYPTLKIFRKPKNGKRAVPDDYRGERSVPAMANAVIDKIPNHVKYISSLAEAKAFVDENVVAVFAHKGKPLVPAMLKALAVDFQETLPIGATKPKILSELLGKDVPDKSLVIFRNGQPSLYDGDSWKRDSIHSYLSEQAAGKIDDEL
ncbi:hypothetical protein CANCADRAFT_122300 [Tortispora caseinolytica NRRL Y-17796]|uniref:Thioredoxin domain-containing protein n=1 Tax=Tortispora caseinolytica NRRL Y-17796 TaxID=767744 RepID=A0A1E4THV0_9ASCO|nr:hypothetical protein CANCADRAFT_122300 [Tortispora caseinolytica NRRL Y-17796]